jgi:DNA-binding transcriptional LysR family regulator
LGTPLLPEIECRADIEAGRLIRLLPEWGAADGILLLVFTSRRRMLPSVRAVIDFAVDAVTDAAS